MNLIFSYSISDDHKFYQAGHTFIGAAEDKKGNEVHVFLKMESTLCWQNKREVDHLAEMLSQIRKDERKDRGC